MDDTTMETPFSVDEEIDNAQERIDNAADEIMKLIDEEAEAVADEIFPGVSKEDDSRRNFVLGYTKAVMVHFDAIHNIAK